MGNYTGVRFKGYIKPEFRKGFEICAINGDWELSSDAIFKSFSEDGRASFIPCGGLSYMPDEWEDKYNLATDGFQKTYNEDSGYWAFQCSLKNYEGTIEKWLEILPYFVEKIEHLEVFYESWYYSKQYDLVNGKTALVNSSFIQYEEDEDYTIGFC